MSALKRTRHLAAPGPWRAVNVPDCGALRRQQYVVRNDTAGSAINTDDTALTPLADVVVRAPAGVALPAIAARLR